MSAALQKFMALRRQYRALVPKRRMTAERHHLVNLAASLESANRIGRKCVERRQARSRAP
jgi:hypothetical protein